LFFQDKSFRTRGDTRIFDDHELEGVIENGSPYEPEFLYRFLD
jgi:hypothetical protein